MQIRRRQRCTGTPLAAVVLLALSNSFVSYAQETAAVETNVDQVADPPVVASADVMPDDATDVEDFVGDAAPPDQTDCPDGADPLLEDESGTDLDKAQDPTPATDSEATVADSSSGESDAKPEEETASATEEAATVAQSGPFIDLLGEQLLSLEMVDETSAQVHQHLTNEALAGKKVVGLYFSADWCGPCRQFTPDLVSFYNKINSRRLKPNEFEIVWVSRCRDIDSFGQYFTQMNWLALPPQEAMGQRGQLLGDKYKVKSIPTLVLLDEIGNVITADARNKIPADKAGIGFPWRSPMSVLISTLVPKSFRLMMKNQIMGILGKVKVALKPR